MARKDYYLVLGVSRNASQAVIRGAFRDLAMRHHPDRAGPGSTERFQEIAEAYRVLGDPGRRAVYDHERGSRTDRPRRAASTGPRPVVEPLNPSWGMEGDVDRGGSRPRSGASDHAESADVVLTLSSEEAGHGGVLELPMPLAIRCPGCGGTGLVSGYLGWSRCPRCSGRAVLAVSRQLPLRLPPGLRDGARFRLALQDALLGRREIEILVRVEG